MLTSSGQFDGRKSGFEAKQPWAQAESQSPLQHHMNYVKPLFCVQMPHCLQFFGFFAGGWWALSVPPTIVSLPRHGLGEVLESEWVRNAPMGAVQLG